MSSAAPEAKHKVQGKKQQVCRFFNTKNGCRAGADCRFLHQSSPQATPSVKPEPVGDVATGISDPQAGTDIDLPDRSASTLPPRQPNPVARPTPQAQRDDPRTFQIGQVQRRFRPKVTENDDNTTFEFGLKPSDPDFPYEIEELQCILTVPKTYPDMKASLQVTNRDIPRGFQLNIERGFDIIVTGNPAATLLNLMNRLDRDLETILAGKMADTIKIVPNRAAVVAEKSPPKPVISDATSQPPTSIVKTPPIFTDQERTAARSKREAHTRQLVARFGKLQAFLASSDGLTYTLPLDSPRRAKWPAQLQNLRSFKLLVPEAYPLEPAMVELDSDAKEARKVEEAFEHLQQSMTESTLTQLANHLTQHIADMAVSNEGPIDHVTLPTAAPASVQATPLLAGPKVPGAASKQVGVSSSADKPHIHVIPRPPEWSQVNNDGDESGESADDTYSEPSDSDDDDLDQEDADESKAADTPSTTQERGVLLSFPHIELYGIELLELTSLNTSVKCERCKELTAVQKLRNYSGKANEMQQVTCKKCANVLAVGFRMELMHANAARAGYLDLEGCTVVDMLPSNFVPTCSECSTAYLAPGVVAVRGDSSFAVCRECHRKMTFRIPEVKFLQVSASAIRASRAPGRRKVKENLGITAGTELSRKGRCKHYAKSYRWFRFSCCSKVFACDRCHDETTDHPNEHANRMLCGFCSREQNYRPEDCGICHAVLIGKRGRGFWEGGKGTRDPARMSRKDPRKYKRRPGTKPKT